MKNIAVRGLVIDGACAVPKKVGTASGHITIVTFGNRSHISLVGS